MSSPVDTRPSLAARLRAARDTAILSQAELAEQLGVSPRTIQNWEAGMLPKQPRRTRALVAFIEEMEARAAA